MSDKINEVLDIRDPPQELIPEVVVPDESELDFTYARENIYGLIEKGQGALTDLADLAKSSQAARMYEVLGNYIKTMVDINERLIDLQAKKKGIDQPAGSVVNNNLVLTTAQLQEMLANMKKKT